MKTELDPMLLVNGERGVAVLVVRDLTDNDSDPVAPAREVSMNARVARNLAAQLVAAADLLDAIAEANTAGFRTKP
jgi:hypothetical protein